jgi:GT2 family glycosyltransferase
VSALDSVSIVVVTHNEGDNLLRTVAGLIATAPEESEVIVVDDFSTDGSIELLQASQPDVRVVRPLRRLGPPNARNFGAQFAGGSFVLWSDAHVDPEPGWFPAFAAMLADPGAGAAGPAVAALGNEANIGFGMRWKNAALDVGWLRREGDEPYAVPIVCGCFLAMRRDVFQQTGGFDSGLVLWGGGEMELCFRLWVLGYECRIAPCAQVAHLFRSRFPYAVSATAVLHNQLRIAITHFNQERLGKVISAMRKNPVFPQAMAMALDSDAWSRRADMLSRRVLDDQAFFDRFPMPGLSQGREAAAEAPL